MRPGEYGKLLVPIELNDRRSRFGQLGPKLILVQEGVEKVILGHEVARLVGGICSWQASKPGIEGFSKLPRSWLLCSIIIIAQHGESTLSQMGVQLSEPGLPCLSSGDRAVHDAGEEDVIDATRQGRDVIEARLDKSDGCGCLPRGKSSQSEGVSTNIKSNHVQAPSGELDGFTTDSRPKHHGCAGRHLVAREHVFFPLQEPRSISLRWIVLCAVTIAAVVVAANQSVQFLWWPQRRKDSGEELLDTQEEPCDFLADTEKNDDEACK